MLIKDTENEQDMSDCISIVFKFSRVHFLKVSHAAEVVLTAWLLQVDGCTCLIYITPLDKTLDVPLKKPPFELLALRN